jgi:hypothetical protein
MMRRLVTSTVLVFAAVIAAPIGVGHAASTVPVPASKPAPTTVVHISPVNRKGDLLPGYSISHDRSGAKCESGSEETGDAYRCFAGNRFYDPCWVASGRTQVICLPAPWSFTAVRLEVTKGYDNAGRSTKTASIPWGVQLTDGVQCALLSGATSTVKGKRVNYACAHVKYVLIGNVDKVHKVWSVRKAKPAGHGNFKEAGRVDLSRAWFGKPSLKGKR